MRKKKKNIVLVYDIVKEAILEFDDNRDAKINPEIWVDKKFECNKMIITFFPEVMDGVSDD